MLRCRDACFGTCRGHVRVFFLYFEFCFLPWMWLPRMWEGQEGGKKNFKNWSWHFRFLTWWQSPAWAFPHPNLKLMRLFGKSECILKAGTMCVGLYEFHVFENHVMYVADFHSWLLHHLLDASSKINFSIFFSSTMCFKITNDIKTFFFQILAKNNGILYHLCVCTMFNMTHAKKGHWRLLQWNVFCYRLKRKLDVF